MYSALHLTSGCNLRCTYCYAGTKVNKNMSEDIAIKAMEFLTKSAKDFLTITLFGGEPLIRFDLIRTVVDWTDRYKEHNGLQRINFRMVTNGTLLTDEIIDYCKDHDLIYTLSFDGDKVSQDTNRKMVSGKGSFDTIMERVPKILSANPYIKLNVIVTPETAFNLNNSVQFLHKTGFRYLDIQPDFGAHWDNSGLKTLRKQYMKIADYYVSAHRKNVKLYINLIDDKIRAQALNQVHIKNSTSCEAGDDQLSIAPSGKIYPCVQFVKDDEPTNWEYSIGDIFNGIDFSRQNTFISRGRRPKDECEGCAFLGRCQNWCACANWQGTGDPGKPSPFLCEHERMLIPIADRVGAILWRERNQLFIDKTYNPAYPLISYMEEAMAKADSHRIKPTNN